MKHRRRDLFALSSLHLLASLWLLSPMAHGQTSLMKEPLADQPRVRLRGTLSPKLRPEDDRGIVPGDFELSYVTLHLKPTEQQQADLDELLIRLQDPKSPEFRAWLTPEQYADRFGASTGDLDRIANWLEGYGLEVVSRARGRSFVVFRGTADQIESAFHTQLHVFEAGGTTHFANVAEPELPLALASAVSNISGLDDFSDRLTRAIPAYGLGAQRYLAPQDLRTIYDVQPLYDIGVTGRGVRVAVIGQTDVNLADITQFQAQNGLPNNPPTKVLVPGASNPGVTSDLPEADLDLEMMSAIAQDAGVVYVFSPSAYTSATYAIDSAIAPVISYSYGGCETGLAAASALSLRITAQQAVTQGITWVASSGDYGAASCDTTGSSASHGISVTFPASVPEVVAVGGTQFDDSGGNYWNAAAPYAARSYIPETAWNESDSTAIHASGGGSSVLYPAPSWQASLRASTRQVPDVAMSAATTHDAFAVVSGGIARLQGGTSAAAPLFAGVVALINQFLGARGLGNINPVLYQIGAVPGWVCSPAAPSKACVFHDIVSGNNKVPCVAGVPGCVGGQMGYSAGPGFDPVTGLGSVDAVGLALAFAPPTVTSVNTASGGTAIAQNTFVEIRGVNLVSPTTPASGVIWSNAPSFASGQMPTNLGGVTVTVNGKPAFIYYYCSAVTSSCPYDQINVLTPLDSTTGVVNVVVTIGGVSSVPYPAKMQSVAPTLLLFQTPYVAATHANYGLIGPTTLYPGYSTPAVPGETVVIYGVGFGLPSSSIVNGSASQTGVLPAVPTCTVGGSPAAVAFAGLISPGLYQLNLTVPPNAQNGDNPIACTYAGFGTPAGDTITIQR